MTDQMVVSASAHFAPSACLWTAHSRGVGKEAANGKGKPLQGPLWPKSAMDAGLQVVAYQ